jgi:hypothetical protein
MMVTLLRALCGGSCAQGGLTLSLRDTAQINKSLHPLESGGKRAALQALRAVRIHWAVAKRLEMA